MRTYAVDLETWFSKEVSVTKMDVWMYCRHPEFECYMVSVCGDDGFEYVGPPAGLDWSKISGPGTRWVAHNAQFDRPVIEWMAEVGQIPANAAPEQWACSADLCAWAGLPRSLANASNSLFGIKPDKSVRDRMVGRRYAELNNTEQTEMIAYAIEDARACLRLWQTLSGGHTLTEGRPYPDLERRLSVYTGEMGQHGVPIDTDALEAGIKHLGNQIWQAEQNIPWFGESPTLSPKALALKCREVGIDPPKSLAKDSEECAAWEDKYGELYPWIGAMRLWRRCNALREKLISMRNRVKPNGRMVYGLKTFGGHTGRWSGGGGVNLQNMARTEMFGVNMRAMIKAPEGRVLVVCDLSQIEPRVAALLCGDTVMMDALKQGFPIYEAHARATMGWAGGSLKNEDPKRYSLAKARVLALGYGAGPPKFQVMAANYGLTLTEEEAKETVADFRASNKPITSMWSRLDNAIRRSVGRDLTIELPSGRLMRWRRVTSVGGLTAETVRNGRYARTRLYGALGLENITQAASRDVMAFHLGMMLDEGIRPILHIHDEVVVECDEGQAETTLQRVIEIMSTTPPWLGDLPLSAEGDIVKAYTK